MLLFYVYILQCNDGAYYTGHTDDIEKRISEHVNGCGSKFTSRRMPLKVVFIQEFQTRSEALLAERQIKGWSRAKKKALIESEWTTLRKLAASYNKLPFD